MTASKPLPRNSISWVGLPILMCLGVILYLPGLLSILVAAVSCAACLLVARQERWKESTRITCCVGVVVVAYGIVGGVVGGSAVIETNHAASAPRIDMNDEASRRKVFDMAMQFRSRIEKSEQDVTDAMQSGARNYDFAARRLASNKAAHDKHQAFTARFYRLNDEQLAKIVNEGIAEDWPY